MRKRLPGSVRTWLPHPFDDPHFQQQIRIMRGVGLEDKNGKPIFESDMIKDHNGCILTVIYSDAQWWVVSDNFQRGLDGSSISRDEYEVIGNVYESPAIA